jgi:hypothetical protein
VWAGYLALQTGAGIGLWVLIATTSLVRDAFELDPARRAVTDAFFGADLVVIASSAVAALGLWRGRRWSPVAAAFTLGGVVYPTVYLVGWVSATGGAGSVALGVMAAVSVLTAWVTWRSWRLVG